MKTKKRILWLGSLVVVLMFITALSGLSAEKKFEGIELTMWEFKGGDYKDKGFEKLCREFEQQTGIKLSIERLEWSAMLDKQVIAGAAGMLPDVMETHVAMLYNSFVRKGYLKPLDDYIEQEGPGFLDKFIPHCVERMRIDGKMYGILENFAPQGLYYNKKMFEEAGIEGPPETWDEFKDYAIRMTDLEKRQYGTGFTGARGDKALMHVAAIVYANGGRLGVVDGEIMINKPEAVEGIQFMMDLINKYKVTPGFVDMDSPALREIFIAGKLGMIEEGGWMTGIIEKSKVPGFEYGIALMPRGKTTGGFASYDGSWTIPTTSRHPDAAWEFIKFITSDEANYVKAVLSGMMPVTIATYERPDLQKDETISVLGKQGSLPNVYDAREFIPIPTDQAAAVAKEGFQKAALGILSVQEAMDEVAKEWEKMLQ